MFAKVKTLVRRVDDNRVVHLARSFQPVEQASNTLVDRGHGTQVFIQVALIFPDRHLTRAHVGAVHRVITGLECAEIGFPLCRGHAVEVISPRIEPEFGRALFRRHLQVVSLIHVLRDGHFLRCCRGPTIVVVEVIRGSWKLGADVFLDMADRRHEISVRGLVMHHKHERLICLALVGKPVDRQIGGDVGGISLDHLSAFRRDNIGIVIFTLIVKHGPCLDARSFGRIVEVPLAEQRGLVA